MPRQLAGASYGYLQPPRFLQSQAERRWKRQQENIFFLPPMSRWRQGHSLSREIPPDKENFSTVTKAGGGGLLFSSEGESEERLKGWGSGGVDLL